MDGVLTDLRSGFRSIRRARLGFSLSIVACLALGIGVTGAVLGVVDALLFRPPPHVARPGQVRRLAFSFRIPGAGEVTASTFSFSDLSDLRAGCDRFAAIAAVAHHPVVIGRGEEARPGQAAVVSGNFFSLLGVVPETGSLFSGDDLGQPTGERPAVLAYETWHRRYGGDPGTVGRVIDIAGEPYRVIGVAPAGFRGLGLEPEDLWLPAAAAGQMLGPTWRSGRGPRSFELFGRLRQGVAGDLAAEQAGAVFRHAHSSHPFYSRARFQAFPVVPARELGDQEVRISLWVAGLSFMVLLIACMNAANLLLARALGRLSDAALRAALGASRWRLAREVAVESSILAAAGGYGALVLLALAGRLVRSLLLPADLAPATAADLRFVGLMMVLSLLAAVLSGGVPALKTWGRDLMAPLREGSATDGAAKSRVQLALVSGQIVFTLMLLVGAGLFLASLEKAFSVDLGIDPRNVLVATLDFGPRAPRVEALTASLERVRQRLELASGVDRASVVAGVPFASVFGASIRLPGEGAPPELPGGGPYLNPVGEGFFRTAGVEVLRGRSFEGLPLAGGLRVAVVNETAARYFWPRRSALGRCLEIGDDTNGGCATVVGIVEDTARQTLRDLPAAQVYVPIEQSPAWIENRALLIRASGAPDSLLEPVRKEIEASQADALAVEVRPLSGLIEPLVRPWEAGARVLGVFGGLALLLALFGVYTVTAYDLGQRRRQLGVRMALGASAGQLRWSLLRGRAWIVGASTALGLVACATAAPRLAPLLFDATWWNPRVLVFASAVVVVSALLASLAAARVIEKIDPAEILRED